MVDLIKARARGNSRAFGKLFTFLADGLFGAVDGGREGCFPARESERAAARDRLQPAKGHWGRPRPNLRVSSSAPRRAGPSTCGSSRLALLGTATKPQVSLEEAAGDGTRGGDGGPRRRSASSAGRDGPRTTQRPRRQDAAGARVPRSSRQCYCCARQRFIFMWRRTKYVASRAMIAASTTSTAVISGLCPNIPTVNVLEEFASV